MVEADVTDSDENPSDTLSALAVPVSADQLVANVSPPSVMCSTNYQTTSVVSLLVTITNISDQPVDLSGAALIVTLPIVSPSGGLLLAAERQPPPAPSPPPSTPVLAQPFTVSESGQVGAVVVTAQNVVTVTPTGRPVLAAEGSITLLFEDVAVDLSAGGSQIEVALQKTVNYRPVQQPIAVQNLLIKTASVAQVSRFYASPPAVDIATPSVLAWTTTVPAPTLSWTDPDAQVTVGGTPVESGSVVASTGIASVSGMQRPTVFTLVAGQGVKAVVMVDFILPTVGLSGPAGQVAPGSTVDVVWETNHTGGEQVTLSWSRTASVTIDGEQATSGSTVSSTGTAQVTVSDRSTLTLSVGGRSADFSITTYAALSDFCSAPDPVRNSQSSVLLTWDATGAEGLTLTELGSALPPVLLDADVDHYTVKGPLTTRRYHLEASGPASPNGTLPSVEHLALCVGPGFAAQLYGGDDYLDLNQWVAIDQTSATFEMWVRIGTEADPSWQDDGMTLLNGWNLNPRISISHQGVGLYWADAPPVVACSRSDVLSGPNSILDDQWHHIAVVLDRDTVLFYIDAVCQLPADGLVLPAGASSTEIQIGPRNYTNGFFGYMSQVRVWSVPRTGAQIASSMGGLPTPAPDGLQLCCDFSGQFTSSGNNDPQGGQLFGNATIVSVDVPA